MSIKNTDNNDYKVMVIRDSEKYLFCYSNDCISLREISRPKRKRFADVVNEIFSITKDNDYLNSPEKQAKIKALNARLIKRSINYTRPKGKFVEGNDEA